MHSNAHIAMDAILIGVAFLTVAVTLERNFLFVSSASVALQTSTDTKTTIITSTEHAKSVSTTTERYPNLFNENDNYGKQPKSEINTLYEHYEHEQHKTIVISPAIIHITHTPRRRCSSKTHKKNENLLFLL